MPADAQRQLAAKMGRRNKIDLPGQRFGRLTVLSETDKRTKSGNVIWHCLCDCGNTSEVASYLLRSGRTKSCGCRQEEAKNFIDLTGERFGRLVVRSATNDRTKKGDIIWKVECDCGTVTEVRSDCLRRGQTKSCGCLRYKHGRSGTLEYSAEHSRRRRAIKRNAKLGDFSAKDIDKKFREWGGECIYCGSKEDVEADHLIPLSRGGAHTLSNLVPACRTCNSSKGNRYLGTEWWPSNWDPL